MLYILILIFVYIFLIFPISILHMVCIIYLFTSLSYTKIMQIGRN